MEPLDNGEKRGIIMNHSKYPCNELKTREFAKPDEQVQSLRGILTEYANPALIEQEKEAWERAVIERYGND